MFLGSHNSFSKEANTRKHKLELDVRGKEDSQGSNNIILSFTELRMNGISILASQEGTCDFLCIELFKVIYNH